MQAIGLFDPVVTQWMKLVGIYHVLCAGKHGKSFYFHIPDICYMPIAICQLLPTINTSFIVYYLFMIILALLRLSPNNIGFILVLFLQTNSSL